MKKITTVAIALIAVLALSAVTATAAKNNKTKKFDSTITVKYDEGSGGAGDPYGEASFNGVVNSGKGFCVKNRKVKIKGKGGIGTVGSDQTNGVGRYRIDASGFGPGDYKAKAVKKKKKKKNGGKIICKSAKADITVQ